MTRFLFVVFLLLVVVFGLSFAVENAQTVQFNYFIGAARLPLSLLLVFAVLGGAVLGALAGMFAVIRLRSEMRVLRRSEAMAREEIRNLRAIPIKDVP